MKKIVKVFILLIIFIPTIVFAKSDLVLTDIKSENVSTGIQKNPDNERDFNYTFNDLNQEVNLTATIKNISDKAIKIDSLSATNPELDFMNYTIEGLERNEVLEANEEKQVTLKISTKQKENIIENFDQNVYFNIKTKNKVESILDNPKTGVISAVVFIGVWLGATFVLFVVFKNKRSKFYKINFIVLLIGIVAIGNGINAEDERVLIINGKVDYQSQNIMEPRFSTITVDYSNPDLPGYATSGEAGDIFNHTNYISRIAFIPYLVDTSDMDDEDILQKYDMSINKDGRVWAYVINRDDGLYDVVIMANGAIYLPEDSRFYFSNMSSLTYLASDGLRTDYVKKMDRMFYNSSNRNFDKNGITEFNLDLSSWNVSNVESMTGMFNYYLYTTTGVNKATIDLSNWDLKNCKDLSHMFEDMLWERRDAIDFKIKFDNWDVSHVENFTSMFECFGRYYNSPLLELDGWTINGNIKHMFMNFGAYSTGQAHLKVTNFTFNTGTEALMENGSGGAPEYMIVEFGNIKVKDTTKDMFKNVSLTTPAKVHFVFENWDTTEVTTMEGMFNYDMFNQLDLTSFDTSNVTNMKNMFSGSSNNGVKVYVSEKWSNAKISSDQYIFGSNLYECPSRTSYPLKDNEYATYGRNGCLTLGKPESEAKDKD